MNKLYSLEKLVAGQHPSIGISHEEYQAIRKSKETLLAALSFEELLEVIVRGYIDIESGLYRAALESSLRFDFSYDKIFEISLEINKLLLGFLTSVRLYLETGPRHAARTSGDPAAILALAKNLASSQYDEKLEYRFMEQFRNHVQHYGLGVHSAAQGSTYDFEKEKRLFYLRVTSFKKTFLKDKGFKKSVLDECGEKIEIFSFAKVYMSSLIKIHEGLREEIATSVTCARGVIEEALRRYGAEAEEMCSNLDLVIRNKETNEIEEKLDVFLGWDDIRLKFQRLNRSLGQIETRIINLH